MVDWPGTPSGQIANRWPGTSATPASPPTGTNQQGLAPQPDPTTAGQPGNPILIQAVKSAIEPITSLPQEYLRIVGESKEEMGRGVENIRQGNRALGAFQTGTGALRYAFSPIEAPVHTIVGKPIEQATGIPHEWTEFAIMLGLPGVGITGSRAGKAALQPLEKVLSPATVSPEARQAEGMIRSAGGTAARDTAQTAATIEPYHRAVNALPDADQLQFMDYVEGRSTGAQLAQPQLQTFADRLRDAFELRKQKLQALSSTAQAHFIEDYFPHFWKDPQQAQAFAKNFAGGYGKQGSGASLKARTMPTIADGIRAGLTPVTTDPIEATMRYVTSMDRFIASQSVLDAAKANGTVRYIRPKTMGASGHPESYRVPDGWVAIKGRGATDATGAQAYAPADWARVYNNYIDRGVHEWSPDIGNMYDKARNASNAITALELGLSGFHAATMAQEAIVSGFARGISNLTGGKPLAALKAFGTAAAAPVLSAVRGHKFEQVYLGRTPGTPDLRRIVDLGEKAGMRAVGKSHAPDYRFSAFGNYWTSFKRGALAQDMRQSLANIKAAPLTGPIKEITKAIGRSMETVAMPLFEKYIPKLKNGAFYETMKDWIERNPTAGYDEQVAAARQVWDSIDNRFGEMVNDNIFWNQTLKQAAQLGMRSYSWNLGTVREIGGGARDIGKVLTGQGKWTDKASYVIALPIVAGTLNSVYQYLKTGVTPQTPEDLLAGQTGGSAPGFGGRGTVPERVMMPGYMKDVLGWHNDWYQEAVNKVATGPRMVGEAFAGKDWRGDPIARPDADVPQWLADYFNWVTGSLGPISARQLARGQKTGSNISLPESLLGARPAPSYLQDPEGYERGMRAVKQRAWKGKERHDRRTEQQYGGPQE